ncbi:hypothetical protein [Methylocystis parvus]|uniref:Uncharacterized protein n=1 Tax=Methylocystis parvus TaxID=134 RepID=A0A6B8MC74_9HYPH|nr:hypothetical protein [Methylocystis parvus]QGM99219.1 hypothetical protein F7D14_18175 [Methylocystis parvus]WBK00400.1 hypothetical protein MMG94_01355 [Methylocystis parvus OBBP]
MVDNPQTLFVSVLLLNSLPAFLLLLLGAVSWASTLGLLAVLASGGVTYAATLIAPALSALLGDDSAGRGSETLLPAVCALECLLAALTYVAVHHPGPVSSTRWIVRMHDVLHGVAR